MSILASAIQKSRADARSIGLVQMHEVEKVLADRYIRDIVEREYEHLMESRPALPQPVDVCEYLACVEVKKSVAVWTVRLDTLLGDEPLLVSDFNGRITHILHPFKEQLP